MIWKKRDEGVRSVEDVCLRNFGVSSTDEINDWFKKSYAGGYKIDKLGEAIELLRKFKGLPVYIMGDYDADGIMATSIMLLTLKEEGFSNVHFMIPHRHSEGYGMNMRMIEDVKKENPEGPVLIFTVDNGIQCFTEIEMAKCYGWKVIVTDHHLGKIENEALKLPNADICIDPAVIEDSATFSKYCGAGIAYKFACEMLGRKEAAKFLPMACIATFADVMPLREENYVIARNGLAAMSKGVGTVGIRALLAVNELSIVQDTDVGFKLAPEINAPGRLMDDGAEIVVRLMTEEDPLKARDLAMRLVFINNERKQSVKSAAETLDFSKQMNNPSIIGYVKDTNPGIIGILAGNVSGDTGKPVIIFTDSLSNPDELVGSARSIEGVHIKDILDGMQRDFMVMFNRPLLVHYGGHEGAAGLTIAKRDYKTFYKMLNSAIERVLQRVDVTDAEPVSYYDLRVSEKNATKVLEIQSKFAPFGEGNPKPLYFFDDFTVTPNNYGDCYRNLGNSGIRLNGRCLAAVTFKYREAFPDAESGTIIPMIGTLTENRYKGISSPQIEILDRVEV